MRKCLIIFFWLLPWPAFATQDYFTKYFLLLSELEFEKARLLVAPETDSLLRFEMLQLTRILFYEGQISRSEFKLSTSLGRDQTPLIVIRMLESGYLDLFYDRFKGDAYKNFYRAHQIAKNYKNPILIKATLYALLRYYNSELGQNTEYHLPYLKQLESIQSTATDRFWVTIYKMIFFTQSFHHVEEDEYFKLSSNLDEFERTLSPNSRLLSYLFYEKALQLDIEKKLSLASNYYRKAINAAGRYPFLKYHRFNGALNIMKIEAIRKNFDSARLYLSIAKNEINGPDSLRSNFSLNWSAAFLMKSQQKYDSAFDFLWRASLQDFQLDFRRNTLEINRLNVELETQEKENANLQLRQNRIWLSAALAGVALLLIASYLAYANQRSKNKVQEKEKEMQSMKMEKLLKDQEIFGIDAMLEGQEKERQKIADDLHDNLGSLLTTLKFNFQSLKTKKDRMESEQELLQQKTDDLLEEAYQNVRAIAHAGNAGVNAKDGLLPSVRNFVSKVASFNQLSIEVEEHGMNERLDNSLEIMIFRMIQELITNVIKHAQATEVTIHLTKYEESINLMVEDNGIGFDISQIKPEETMGLYSIQKKIENLGGRVTIDSISKKGTSIIIDIPLA